MYLNDYLPSKSFRKRLLAILIIIAVTILLVLGIKLIGKGIKSYRLNRQIKQLPVELRSQIDSLTVGELQKKDSNNNGIFDWEERLYGLDPLGDGAINKQTVEEKRKLLRDSAGDNEAVAATGDTNDFTREFLSIITSLQTSGALNEDALNNIANSIGGKLISENQPELYAESAFKIVRDTEVTKDEYQRLSSIEIDKLASLPMMGYEIEFLSESLRSNDPSLLVPLDTIANTYSSFAKALVRVPVPASLIDAHKALVNSSEYVGRSLLMIQQINTDPMLALKGIALYNTHFMIMNNSLDELASGLNL